jgi:hydrogenase maturation protease
MPRLLIVGYGNPLRGDDGFGYRAAELLRETVTDPEVEILAVHQLTPELMEAVSRAARVIFLDAAVGPEPGRIEERRLQPGAPNAAFTHHATPEALLAGARALYGASPKATLITVTGLDFSYSMELSPLVASALATAMARCKLP